MNCWVPWAVFVGIVGEPRCCWIAGAATADMGTIWAEVSKSSVDSCPLTLVVIPCVALSDFFEAIPVNVKEKKLFNLFWSLVKVITVILQANSFS